MSRFVTRSFCLAACLIAAPAIAQESNHQGSDAMLADNVIELVIGKQPSSRTKSSGSRTGVLGRLFGSKQQSSPTQNRSSSSSSRSRSGNSQPLPSPFIPTPSSSVSDGEMFSTSPARVPQPSSNTGERSVQPRVVPRPVAPGAPQPLLDPEDRAAMEAARQATSAAIPSASQYDDTGSNTSESSRSESLKSTTITQDENISIDRSLSDMTSTSSRRRTTFGPTEAEEETVEVTTESRSSRRSIASFPSVPRKALPSSRATARRTQSETTETVTETTTETSDSRVAEQRSGNEQQLVDSSEVVAEQHNAIEVAKTESNAQARVATRTEVQGTQLNRPTSTPQPRSENELADRSNDARPQRYSSGTTRSSSAHGVIGGRGTSSREYSVPSRNVSTPSTPEARSSSQGVRSNTFAGSKTTPAEQSVPTRTTAPRTARAPTPPPKKIKPRAPEMKVDPRDHNARIMTSEIPFIRVTTHGPEEIQINEVAEYKVIVENKGSIDAPGVLIRASLPKWAVVRGHQSTTGTIEPQPHQSERRMIWQMNELRAGKSETLTLRISAERPETFDVGVEWTVLPQQRTAQIRVQQPQVKLVIEGPDEVIYGESQVYKVRVMNPGNGIAEDVSFTLSPNSATPQKQDIGTIPPGKEAQFEIELTAQDRGGLQIHGLAGGRNELRDEQIKDIRVLMADLVATLNGPPMKYHDTMADYKLTIKNEGTATCDGIVAVLRIPPGVKYKSGISGAESVGEFLRWKIAHLSPGASVDYDLQCQMSGVGSHLLAFECRGSAAGRATVSLATEVEAIADLVLTINDPPAPAPVGEEVAYEIVIRNRGTRAAEAVKAIAQFSNGIEPIQVSGHAGEIVPGQVLFDTIPRIDAGEEVTLTVRAKAAGAAHHRFRAEVTAGETILVAEEATRYIEINSDRISRHSNSSNTSR